MQDGGVAAGGGEMFARGLNRDETRAAAATKAAVDGTQQTRDPTVAHETKKSTAARRRVNCKTDKTQLSSLERRRHQPCSDAQEFCENGRWGALTGAGQLRLHVFAHRGHPAEYQRPGLLKTNKKSRGIEKEAGFKVCLHPGTHAKEGHRCFRAAGVGEGDDSKHATAEPSIPARRPKLVPQPCPRQNTNHHHATSSKSYTAGHQTRQGRGQNRGLNPVGQVSVGNADTSAAKLLHTLLPLCLP